MIKPKIQESNVNQVEVVRDIPQSESTGSNKMKKIRAIFGAALAGFVGVTTAITTFEKPAAAIDNAPTAGATKEVTKEEIEKIGEFNRDASSLIRSQLRREGKDSEGHPSGTQNTTERKPSSATSEGKTVEIKKAGKYIIYRQIGNIIEFKVDPRLTPSQQALLEKKFTEYVRSKYPKLKTQRI